MFRVLVFDLDGTLVDSRRDIADAANDLLATYDAAPLDDETVVRMVGEGARLLVSRVLAARGIAADLEAALARFVELYERRLVDHTRPYPGVTEVLPVLAGRATLAVLTNKPQAAADRLLAELGLARFFARVVGGDTVLGRKPAPDGLQTIVSLAHAVPAATLMVGDSWVDVETARRAGTRVCFAEYGFGAPPKEGLAEGELRISRFDELLGIVGE
ncbi:MAG TPA: HAD-IA family hydrolase [Vicinamibacterales bacterium]